MLFILSLDCCCIFVNIKQRQLLHLNFKTNSICAFFLILCLGLVGRRRMKRARSRKKAMQSVWLQTLCFWKIATDLHINKLSWAPTLRFLTHTSLKSPFFIQLSYYNSVKTLSGNSRLIATLCNKVKFIFEDKVQYVLKTRETSLFSSIQYFLIVNQIISVLTYLVAT